MFDISLAGGAALAGLLSFFTPPCILPMVPFYLSYMAGGLSMSELTAEGEIAPGGAQRRLVTSAVMFALGGVTTIFMLMGMGGATALGQAFAQWKQVLAYAGAGGLLFVFGLHFLGGVIRIGLLYREARIESKSEPTTVIGAYLMGLAFGFGWTPCVGPALTAILMMAAGMGGSLAQGGAGGLLAAYGLAMTAPFVVAALFARPFLGWMARNRRHLPKVEKAMGGVMLILFAVLIATGSVNVISNWLIQAFPGFMNMG